ncbi:MAG: hypothetical protein VKP62_04145 [Candidatus Sericytochromatia bacterium]|nr:hypothetical protein [Candidatus Sericytochromatia bacterium]
MFKSMRVVSLAWIAASLLAGCGRMDGLAGAPSPVALPAAAPAELSQATYALQSSPATVLFHDDFDYATQASLDSIWASSSDFKGVLPMIHPAPTAHQLVKPGLGGSLQAVAAGRDGKAYSANRFMLELRKPLAVSRGFEGSKRTLSFQYARLVSEGPKPSGKPGFEVLHPTAPLQVQISYLNSKPNTWKTLWDSREEVLPMSYPGPKEMEAQVALPTSSLRLRFVTLAGKKGQMSPRIDNVVVAVDLPGPITGGIVTKVK